MAGGFILLLVGSLIISAYVSHSVSWSAGSHARRAPIELRTADVLILLLGLVMLFRGLVRIRQGGGSRIALRFDQDGVLFEDPPKRVPWVDLKSIAEVSFRGDWHLAFQDRHGARYRCDCTETDLSANEWWHFVRGVRPELVPGRWQRAVASVPSANFTARQAPSHGAELNDGETRAGEVHENAGPQLTPTGEALKRLLGRWRVPT